MTKRLSERVFARIKSNAKRSINHNAVVFSALHDEIVDALNDGCSLKAIWETLYEEGKISFKFDAFLRYSKKSTEIASVNNSIKRKKIAAKKKSVVAGKHGLPIQAQVIKNEKRPPREPKSQSTKIDTFEFNPTDNPEDLI